MSSQFSLVGTKTAENLAKAFAGESQARNRYQFYAEIAAKSGYESLNEVFLETADNERGHAEIFFEYMAEGLGITQLNPQVLVPVAMGDIPENLLAAARGEYFEWSNLYPAFAQTAEKEGFSVIAKSFLCIADIEKRHDNRFRDLLRRYNNNMLYKNNTETVWECLNCGFRHRGLSAPEKCPACHHPQKFFIMVCDDVLGVLL